MLRWIGLAVGVAIFLLWLVCVAIILIASDPTVPHFGNHAENVAALQGEGADFRFAVLGDTQKGTTGLRRMLAHLRDEQVAFMVHTGDLVSDSDPGHYRLARRVLANAPLSTPLVVVPGNHDVKPDRTLFEKNIGPREISFSRDRIHFILVDTALGLPPNASLLEARLQSAGDATIVLFMHQPPFDRESETFRPKPGYEEVVNLIRRYRVTYVFSGHLHGYRRLKDGDTTYIANGVGGDYEHWKLDEDVHATLVEVHGREITDRIITLGAAHSVWDNVEHLALGHVAEAYRQRPLLTYPVTALFLAVWIWTLMRLRRQLFRTFSNDPG